MEIKDGVIYLFNVQSIDINEIESFVFKFKFIKDLDKNNNFLNNKDKKLHLISLFFIINYLQTNNISNENLKFDNNHFLINNGNHYFSISHKNNYVAFISNSNPIGIDIETINKTINIDIVKKYFNNHLKNLNKEKFLLCWTKSESLLKCSGISFSEACKIINSSNDLSNIDNVYYFKSEKYKNMFITICYKHQINNEYKICELNYLPK